MHAGWVVKKRNCRCTTMVGWWNCLWCIQAQNPVLLIKKVTCTCSCHVYTCVHVYMVGMSLQVGLHVCVQTCIMCTRRNLCTRRYTWYHTIPLINVPPLFETPVHQHCYCCRPPIHCRSFLAYFVLPACCQRRLTCQAQNS